LLHITLSKERHQTATRPQFLSANAGKPSRERLTLIRIFEVEGCSAIGSRNTPTAGARL
jgi:hypothetical protein